MKARLRVPSNRDAVVTLYSAKVLFRAIFLTNLEVKENLQSTVSFKKKYHVSELNNEVIMAKYCFQVVLVVF